MYIQALPGMSVTPDPSHMIIRDVVCGQIPSWSRAELLETRSGLPGTCSQRQVLPGTCESVSICELLRMPATGSYTGLM